MMKLKVEHIDLINKFGTKKSVLFENLDNITEQLEPLLNDNIEYFTIKGEIL